MSLVFDASVIVAALVDSGSDGEWAAGVLVEQVLAAPHHMPIEAANVLRRAARAADLSADSASLAHADLLELRVELFPYWPLAEPCWELRENIASVKRGVDVGESAVAVTRDSQRLST